MIIIIVIIINIYIYIERERERERDIHTYRTCRAPMGAGDQAAFGRLAASPFLHPDFLVPPLHSNTN